jgi:hypothetical protein
MELDKLAADLEAWLLRMDWSPDLPGEQKRAIASIFARAYAGDWQRGSFIGVPVPDEDELPEMWREIATVLEQKLAPIHGSGAGVLAEFYAKHAVASALSGSKMPWLAKAAHDGDDVASAALTKRILKGLEPVRVKRALICVHPGADASGRGAQLAVNL